ncbi:MAG TPA: hypothetical protein VML96_06935 [Egibacteraceae bacterium]|nr:hypothetical protein [Egibacteraceae bacterium]
MTTVTISAHAARRALLTRDLTDPAQGSHAMQSLIDAAEGALAQRWGVDVRRIRSNPVVPVEDNYNRLRYGPDAAARDGRYSRYLTDDLMLRSHTSACVPAALETVAAEGTRDAAISVPGIVYRRDAIDREHVGEPHQLDLWRIRSDGSPLGIDDLEELVCLVIGATLPGRAWRWTRARHPYTEDGRQVDVAGPGGWLEVGECGLAHPEVLTGAGLSAATGLASGWGLDRLVMIRKGIDDIRLLRSPDPRIAGQMLDLDPYRPVSSMPAAIRDLSVAMESPADAELIGDEIRALLGPQADLVESVTVVASTPGEDLPAAILSRLGMQRDQHNVLLRIMLRTLDRTLTAEEANRLRDRIYAGLHQGARHQWAASRPG